MTNAAFPAETPAARITELGEVLVDNIKYVAHHITGDVWAFQRIGKRGKPVNQYRAARVVAGEVVYVARSYTRF